MMTLVMKFGGTSVGSAAAIRRTAVLIERYQQEYGQVVVIASGMGTKPVKVTDLLLQGCHTAAQGDRDSYKQIAAQLQTIHHETIDELLKTEAERTAVTASIDGFIAHFRDLCHAIAILGELSPRALDAIAGMGEQMSVRLLAAYLREQGFASEAIDATHLIVTDDGFTSATPLIAQTNAHTRPTSTLCSSRARFPWLLALLPPPRMVSPRLSAVEGQTTALRSLAEP
jgi:aspartokinase/homoserine dehydrogenase 1